MPRLTGLPFLDEVRWITCKGDGGQGTQWCPLETVDLESIGVIAGVYIIWHEGNPSRVVRVGQGAPIKDRLGAHRLDREITAYGQIGKLRVTWAAVPASQRDGVERYLADKWKPLVGDAFPNAVPIAVNSPW
jgi:hypothetical protein